MTLRKLVETLLQDFGKLSEVAEGAAERMQSTCRRGCTWCCYLLAHITLADALPLAQWVLDQPNWQLWLDRLREASFKTIGLDGRGLSVGTYFRQAIPCVFLDTATRDCRAYSHRPVACRTHYVVTDPELCKPGEVKRTGVIDLLKLEKFSWDASLQIAGEPLGGPIPLMTLYACGVFTTNECDSRVTAVEKAMDGLPHPTEYVLNSHEQDRPWSDRLTDRGLTEDQIK